MTAADRTARDDINQMIQSAKSSLDFAAPETHDEHWQRLTNNLTSYVNGLTDTLGRSHATDPVPPRRVFLVVHPRGGPPWAGTDEARAHEFARNTGQVVAELPVSADYSTEETQR
jgi:hypothetical protein